MRMKPLLVFRGSIWDDLKMGILRMHHPKDNPHEFLGRLDFQCFFCAKDDQQKSCEAEKNPASMIDFFQKNSLSRSHGLCIKFTTQQPALNMAQCQSLSLALLKVYRPPQNLWESLGKKNTTKS